jgi:hypothetical protein
MFRVTLLLLLLFPLPAFSSVDFVAEKSITVFGGEKMHAVISEVARDRAWSPHFVMDVNDGLMACLGKVNAGLKSYEEMETTCPGGHRFVTTRKGSKGRVVVDWLGAAPKVDAGPGDDIYWWHDSIFSYLRKQKRR